jgi:lipopolysaccharide biosynthesis glycosyltransferase
VLYFKFIVLNILYCFDSNYNNQAFVSLYSLLQNINQKVNIYVIHKENSDSSFFPEKILKHQFLNLIEVSKFNKEDIDFYNLEDAHVTEATFYRLFMLNYIPNDLDFITYLDADIMCLSNPVELISKELKNLTDGDFEAGFAVESYKKSSTNDSFSRLNLNGEAYFNAGVMVFDVRKAKSNQFTKNIGKIITSLKENAVYWDQDVLNKYYDDNYLQISEKMNYKINFIDTDYSKFLNDKREQIVFVHYSGKFKPWSIRGIAHSSAFIFQDSYRKLFGRKYYISSSRKIIALKDMLKIIFSFKFQHIKYPISFIYYSVKYILRTKNG